jgi:hypothetical protein
MIFMRFTVSPEQLKFFQAQNYLELENLLSKEETISLLTAIDTLRTKSPGYPVENIFRSTPFVASLIRKRGYGHIAVELLHKKPLRLLMDKFFMRRPDFTDPLDDDCCGLLLELNSGKGLFFKQLPTASLYKAPLSCYFLLVMTSKYLPEQLNPLIVR